MEIVTKIKNKIKDFSEKESVMNAFKIGSILLLMIISFTFGKLSSMGGERTVSKNVSIYLPSGDLYSKNNAPVSENPLTAYVLGGATDSYRALQGPTVTERVTAVENSPEYAQMVSSNPNSSLGSNAAREGIFGSKNGTTYYTIGCKSGNRIKPENKVYFTSEIDAQDQGYRKSKLCK